MRRTCRRRGLAALLVLSIAIEGCVAPPPPREVDLAHAVIVGAPLALQADVANVDARAAGKGAGGGAATGAATGAVACVPALFLYPLCVALMAGIGAGVGAAAGGAIGRVVLDDDQAVTARRAGLIEELQSSKRQTALVNEVQRRLRDDFARDVKLVEAAAASAPASASAVAGATTDVPWQVEVGMTLVGTEGGSRTFSLHLEANARVRRRADGLVVYSTDKEVKSETELDVNGWLAADGRALRGVLDRCTAQVARNLAFDLVQPPYNIRMPTPPPRQAKRFSSCDDEPADWRPPPAPKS